ncbi:hypothetical protein [Microcoleus sp. LEGE 07076]|uniref:hypothetical protein n=1 Tax=Microcoleus sp. LEGE 07076 TaxID=915322 RepID=UPI00187E11DE|nr:hypothetical protein [Microcoleus sp. LEGE 07076]
MQFLYLVDFSGGWQQLRLLLSGERDGISGAMANPRKVRSTVNSLPNPAGPSPPTSISGLPKSIFLGIACIGIIKSSQQLTLNHSVFRPPVNSQQSTIMYECNRN